MRLIPNLDNAPSMLLSGDLPTIKSLLTLSFSEENHPFAVWKRVVAVIDDARPKLLVWKCEQIRALSNGHDRPTNVKHDVVPDVLRLTHRGGPTTVSGLVVARLVRPSVKRRTARARPHIRKELAEGLAPASADSYSSSAIHVVLGVTRVLAAIIHRPIGTVFACLSASSRMPMLDMQFAAPAAAMSGKSGMKARSRTRDFDPAFAAATPIRRPSAIPWDPRQHRQKPKFATGKFIFQSHPQVYNMHSVCA